MEEIYKQKNKTFKIGENEYADKVLYMLENSVILSDAFKTRIRSIIQMILSYNVKKECYTIGESINELTNDISFSSILSEKFINELKCDLYLALNIQLFCIKKTN